MKKSISIWQYIITVIALMMLGHPSSSYCQDLIIDLQYYDEYSIVRNIDDEYNLVYNHGKDNRFYRIDFSSICSSMFFPGRDNMKILDFEIFNDYVFFCGIDDTISPDAVFGYFKLGNFPPTEVYFDVREEWESFTKLDVFIIEGEYHVVMTATYHSGVGTMMDVRGDVSGAWIYCDADLRDEYWYFNDVAVTDEYIVYTSTGNKDEMIQKAHPNLWYIKKPTSSGYSIFNNVSGNMFLGDLQVSVLGDILIEHLVFDEIVIVHRSDMYNFKVSYLDGLNYQRTVNVSCNDDCIIKDIKIGLKKFEVEVLTNKTSTNTIVKSELYSVPYTVPGPTCSVNYKYPTLTDEVINSIDIMSFFNYVGSGHDYLDMSLHAYRIDMLFGSNCFVDYNYNETVHTYDWKKPEIDFPQRNYPYEIFTIVPDGNTSETADICPQKIK